MTENKITENKITDYKNIDYHYYFSSDIHVTEPNKSYMKWNNYSTYLCTKLCLSNIDHSSNFLVVPDTSIGNIFIRVTLNGNNNNYVLFVVKTSTIHKYWVELDVIYMDSNGYHFTMNDHILISFVISEKCNLYNNYNSIKFGTGSGSFNQSLYSIAMGFNAGNTNQSRKSLAFGYYAGYDSQSENSIAFGSHAAECQQGGSSMAFGNFAARLKQGNNSMAFGNEAASDSQGNNSMAFGNGAGQSNQGDNSMAFGNNAGSNRQGLKSIAFGNEAGYLNQGDCSMAFGNQAGYVNQDNNTIIINASGEKLNSVCPYSTYIKPIRKNNIGTILLYNEHTGELINSELNVLSINDITCYKKMYPITEETFIKGKGKIPAGTTETIITLSHTVETDAIVCVTIIGQPICLISTSEVNGNSFKVFIDKIVNTDVAFNWIVS